MKTKNTMHISLLLLLLLSALPLSAGGGPGQELPCGGRCRGDEICVNGECVVPLENRPFCGDGILQEENGEQCERGAARCDEGDVCLNCRCEPEIIQPWINMSILAFALSVSLIAFLYMGGTFFQNQTLKAFATDELVQLAFTGFTIAVLFAFVTWIDFDLLPAFAGSIGEEAGEEAGSLQEYALQTAEDLQAFYSSLLFNTTRNVSVGALATANMLGEEGSKSGYCYLMNVGYSINTCSALNSLRAPITNAATSLSIAVADTTAQIALLLFSSRYAFAVLLPLGIFLRTFSFTRRAGGALIAFAIGFYIVFPLAFLFGEKILIGVLAMTLDAEGDEPAYYDSYLAEVSTYPSFLPIDSSIGGAERCEPFSYHFGDDVQGIRDKHITGKRCREGRTVNQPLLDDEGNQVLDENGDPVYAYSYFVCDEWGIYTFEPPIFQVYIRSLLMAALNLTITLIFIQWLAGILGAQIDVSTLMRLSQ